MRSSAHRSAFTSSLLLASLVCAGVSAQSIIATRKVTDGPVDKAVNEVAISRDKLVEHGKTVMLWNIQDPPAQGDQQAPIEIGYRVSMDGGLTWEPEQILPAPAGSSAELDCSVLDFGRVVASAIAEFPNELNAYVVTMPPGSNTFDDETLVHFDTFDVTFTRLGISTRGIGEANEELYLMTRSREPATFDQIAVRVSPDYRRDVVGAVPCRSRR